MTRHSRPVPNCLFLIFLPRPAVSRAGNGTRTRDPNLGKVVLYQLSYSRVSRKATGTANGPSWHSSEPIRGPRCRLCLSSRARTSGGEGNRTPDLLNAIQALSQLSY